MTNIRYDEFLLEMFFFRKYRIAGSGDKVELFPLSEQMFLHLLHQQSNGLGANSILLYDDDDVGDDDGGDDDGDDGDDSYDGDDEDGDRLIWSLSSEADELQNERICNPDSSNISLCSGIYLFLHLYGIRYVPDSANISSWSWFFINVQNNDFMMKIITIIIMMITTTIINIINIWMH